MFPVSWTSSRLELMAAIFQSPEFPADSRLKAAAAAFTLKILAVPSTLKPAVAGLTWATWGPISPYVLAAAAFTSDRLRAKWLLKAAAEAWCWFPDRQARRARRAAAALMYSN